MESLTETMGPGPLLLATKLHPPMWRSGLVSRPQLVAALRRGAESKLTLISAPAGFGKSTLLAEWLADASDDRSTSWVSLDRNDNDPALFWTYVIAALRIHDPGLGERSLALLRSIQAPAPETMLTSLINELSSSPKTFVLVLDDVHAIENGSIHEAIGFLLEHLPTQLRLVMTTRADPPINLSRLRVRGELNELRAADLRFTPDETRAFLNDVMELHLSEDNVRALDARSEGWIAGLQLAGLSVRDHLDPTSFIQNFAGDHRYIVDYLLEEVLQRQTEDTRSFLLQTSILDRMCESLCDTLTGQRGGAARLEMLERGNFFLIPLDSTRTWYRYHHLFAEVLKARLLAEYPEQVGSLHLRASEWYEQQGAAAEAIEHALAAGAYDRAGDLVELAARGMQRNRQEATMLGWLAAIPEAAMRRRPVLSTIYAGVLMSNGMLDGVDAWLRNAERWLEVMQEQHTDVPVDMLVADREELSRLPGSVAVYRAGFALATGDITQTVEHARSALEVIPEDDQLYRGAAAALLGLASWYRGELGSAFASYADGMANLRQGGYIVDAIGGSVGLTDLRIAQGRLHDAMDIYRRGLLLSSELRSPAPRGTADMYLGMSQIFWEWNDLEAASHHLAQSEALGEPAGFPHFPWRLRVAQAKVRANLGDLEGAYALLDEAEHRYVSDMLPNVRPIPAMRARVRIAQGRLDDALAWVRAEGIFVDEPVSFLRIFDHLTLARVVLARAADDRSEDTARSAMRLLARLRDAADDGGWTGSLLEVLVVQALGYQQLGNGPAAHASIERALSLAQAEGYVRIFADEGEPMRRLLREVASGPDGSNAQRVLRAWGAPDRSMANPGQAVGLVEPLTPREIEILQLIAAGLRNQEIADQLYISLPTVKRHVANAYGKLDVTHRTEAIARAKVLGLL